MTATQIPLKHLASLNPEALDENTDPEYTFRYVDISTTGHGELREEPHLMKFGSAPSRARRVLRPGDTILSTVRTYLRAVWTVRDAADPLVASTGFVCLRPRATVDPRFLGWVAQADTVIEEIVARSVGVSYPAINPSEVGRIKVPELSLPRQRAIADYLDRETARIDALITAKQRMETLLEERDQAELSHLVAPMGRPLAHLRYFATIQGGITVDAGRSPGPDAVTLPYLRVANVQAGRLDLTDVTDITVPRALATRSSLRKNDVLMTEGGDIDKLGRGTVWQGELDGCLHQNHIFAVRPDPVLLDAWYLALLSQSDHARAYFESTGVQSTNLASTSAFKILDLPIPVLPLQEQQDIVAEWRRRSAPSRRALSALGEQISLLQERRQALITAAVTGQLDIPEAA